MKAFPTESKASITKGLWFVFPLDRNAVRAWGSAITGLERIYVGEVLVSEQRNVGRVSTHKFMVDGEEYAVTFQMISLLQGRLDCRLTQDGKTIKAYTTKFGESSQPTPDRFLLSLFAGACVGLLASYVKMPLWAIALLCFTAASAVGINLERVRLLVEELAQQGVEGPTSPPSAEPRP